ncbi:sensor histidine kinase [Luethyella okanaganae]|uniref:Sensor histidine kinase n=1 Tax=Luethyella okanaganae TaxID=69372 RepID=A0ABW1VCN9_9MICO
MQRILKERDRLLRRTARLTGLTGTSVAAVCVCIPGAVSFVTLVSVLALFGIMAIGYYLLGTHGAIRWAVVVLVSGIAAMLLIGTGPLRLNSASVTTVAMIGSAALGALALVLLASRARIALLASSFVTVVTTVAVTTVTHEMSTTALGLVVCTWAALVLAGWWISQSVPRIMQRIASIGRAHQAERHASEVEAQRRQDARLLHDTVLATLTLLAHSGVGVSAEALRHQAADDAQLLRQLRLGGLPTPRSSGVYTLEPVAESALGKTLESVKQRFGRMGLEVNWHGSGQVLLQSGVLDAFLGALGECLENVRRHAGVAEADVTITDDETTVRAMVTDSGVGFELGDVDRARLGFAESVVGRLREVGGNARLFSSPGSGTTVVLEVPK